MKSEIPNRNIKLSSLVQLTRNKLVHEFDAAHVKVPVRLSSSSTIREQIVFINHNVTCYKPVTMVARLKKNAESTSLYLPQ